MDFIEKLEGYLKSQNEYDYEIIRDRGDLLIRLGQIWGRVGWRSIMMSESPYKTVQHAKECLRKQSVVCPKCGELVRVEIYGTRHETYYDAFCKNCYWSSDDKDVENPINEWLEENDYYFTCDCPLVEHPPIAPSWAESIFKNLYWKNHSSLRKANENVKY